TARAALARGDLFGAYDAAAQAIAAGDASEDLHHQQALILARMGDTGRALDIFRSAGLDRSDDPHRRALGARLLKDRGLEGSRPELVGGYRAYLQIWKESGDTYPGINAASLALLLGKPGKARRLAARILEKPEILEPRDYYCAATRAEAKLILGEPDAAAEAARLSLTLPNCSVGARATTMRQLAIVADKVGLEAAAREPLLALLRAPASFHFAGHMFVPDPVQESRIAAEVEAALEARRAEYAYGSIAAGADILVAEAVIRRGGELHIILPCALPDFIAQSVRPAGEEWVDRAQACLAAASSVTYASSLEYVSDPTLFSYGAAVAMGRARLRAQHLSADTFQLAIWDGKTGGPVGTGADVGLWRSRGGETHVVDSGGVDRGYKRPETGTAPPLPRRTASILFTDYAGFSRLTESSYPLFDREIMGRIADVLAQHDAKVLARNTWGDALYTVMDGAIAGAEIALHLQQVLKEADPAVLGLASDQGGMRIALHYGSVYQSIDLVTGLPNFLGNEVARAARIEPVTPPGDVYVTEPFAAMIALHAPDRFHCRYVGQVDLAKKYGAFPMYRLTASDSSR
ncbi:MAG TPA: adenylate/guanylate cyclase domain-containing protein, partial [Allosphingosinicella sp.]